MSTCIDSINTNVLIESVFTSTAFFKFRVSLYSEYLQVILFVSELEELHIKTTVGAFQSCNKEGLVRTLWKNHLHEPRVRTQ